MGSPEQGPRGRPPVPLQRKLEDGRGRRAHVHGRAFPLSAHAAGCSMLVAAPPRRPSWCPGRCSRPSGINDSRHGCKNLPLTCLASPCGHTSSVTSAPHPCTAGHLALSPLHRWSPHLLTPAPLEPWPPHPCTAGALTSSPLHHWTPHPLTPAPLDTLPCSPGCTAVFQAALPASVTWLPAVTGRAVRPLLQLLAVLCVNRR